MFQIITVETIHVDPELFEKNLRWMILIKTLWPNGDDLVRLMRYYCSEIFGALHYPLVSAHFVESKGFLKYRGWKLWSSKPKSP